MKGRKGLIEGITAGGFKLTQVSKAKFYEIKKQLTSKKLTKLNLKNSTDRTISSMDEAPFKRLTRTPAYQKFKEGKLEQIVETDFLYFYGINWRNSKASVQEKIKNVDLVISNFEDKNIGKSLAKQEKLMDFIVDEQMELLWIHFTLSLFIVMKFLFSEVQKLFLVFQV